jgi:hypothetical protein
MDIVLYNARQRPRDIVSGLISKMREFPPGTQFVATLEESVDADFSVEDPHPRTAKIVLRLEELEELKEVDNGH